VRALIKVTKLDSAPDELVSIDETLKMVDNNRTRIRTLAGILLTVCGLLLSTSFVVLTFILKNSDIRISRFVPIFLFATSGLLTGSIICIVFSSRLPKPVALISKIELLDFWTRIYRREYLWVTVAVYFLIAAIVLFIAALGVLGTNVIK
jgi:hypothetical protein